MKKFVLICMALVLVASMSVSAFAANGGFVSSPSGKPAPELIKGENESEDCEAQIIITSYSDRNQLDEETRQQLEVAYTEIVGTDYLAALNEMIAQIAAEKGVDPATLAVSDLFDISATDCSTHAEHGHFDITLKADTLANFVCLLHFYNGEWHVVENAEVTNNGEHLEFDEDEFSPFAIVVGTPSVGGDADDDSNLGLIIGLCCAGAAVIGAGIIAAIMFSRKKRMR